MTKHTTLHVLIAAMAAHAGTTLLAAPTTSPATETRPTLEPVTLLPSAMAARLAAAYPWLGQDPVAATDADERRQIADALDRMASNEAKVELALAWANWELAEPTAVAATRWCLGYRTHVELDVLRDAAARADAALKRADAALATVSTTENDIAAERKQRRWAQTRERLGLFAGALAALGQAVPANDSPETIEEAIDHCADAALDLAELRESEHTPTASAATLWQALLLQAAGRGDRALATLEPALLPPSELPYDWFQRIVRCQILVEQGSHALVDGLFIRMHAMSDEWFVNQPQSVAPARTAIEMARTIALHAWVAAVPADAPDAKAVADWADRHSGSAGTADASRAPYLLEPAIPIYQLMPDLTGPATQPTTTTAATTRPATSTQPTTTSVEVISIEPGPE